MLFFVLLQVLLHILVYQYKFRSLLGDLGGWAGIVFTFPGNPERALFFYSLPHHGEWPGLFAGVAG